MDDIQKNQINRFLQRFGVRLLRSPYYKFPYDRENFLDIDLEKKLVIFDIGANIGQSSIWLTKNFPEATIYAFEPFPIIFNYLEKKTYQYKSIKSYNFAMGSVPAKVTLSKVKDPFCQNAKVVESLEGVSSNTQSVDIITINTLDKFCAENSIDVIHILKTDTEGYDIEVLKGAEKLLKENKIMNILSEASIDPNDKEHTNFFELKTFLEKYNFQIFSFYDLHHNHKTGKLNYFNALFKKR